MDGPALTLRRAGAQDAGPLGEMNRRLIEDEGSRNPMSVERLQSRMAAFLRGGYEADLFAHGSLVVGYALYRRGLDDGLPERATVHLRQFFIERDLRGQGLGREAFARLQKERFGDAALWLEVLTENAAALSFWRRLGFEPYAVTMTSHRSDQPHERDAAATITEGDNVS